MELPIITIANLLEDLFPEVNWFVNDVDESNQVNPNYPLGRVLEIGGSYGSYASADPNYINTTVQVDMWVENMKQLNDYYYTLDKKLRNYGIQCNYTEQTQDQDLKTGRRIIKRYTVSQQVI